MICGHAFVRAKARGDVAGGAPLGLEFDLRLEAGYPNPRPTIVITWHDGANWFVVDAEELERAARAMKILAESDAAL